MKREIQLLLVIAGLVLPTALRAQVLSSGIIAPTRAIDWSQVGVQGGIQSRSIQCGSTIAAYSGAASTINSAISSCASGGYVLLGPGTFTLSSGINMGVSNVTLRGSGPKATIVKFTGGSGCAGPAADVCFEGSFSWFGGPQHSTTWTAGYAKGTTVITLGSTSGLSVGQWILLDQDDDFTDNGAILVADASSNSGSCNNQIFATDNSAASSSPGRNFGAGTVAGTSTACRGGVYPDRNQNQIVQVTNISGTTVTITPGLYADNWRSSQNPGAWWPTTMATGDSIESMTLDHTSDTSSTSGIMFFNVVNSWVSNVRDLNSNRNHVWFQYAAHDSIVNSYFYGTQNGAAESYGIESWISSDDLIENNIEQHITSPWLEGGCEGCVYAYNFATDDHYTNPNWLIQTIDIHDAAAMMDLKEGNEGTGDWGDVIHGTHDMDTSFRNRFIGIEGADNQQTIPMIMMAHNRYMNIIGNVLGTSGYHTNYQTNYAGTCNGNSAVYNVSIYAFGWSGQSGSSGLCNGSIQSDTLTATSAMRWGNYDTVNAAVSFNSSEVPSSFSDSSGTPSLYVNAVPSSQSLPPSLFLSSPPASWWKTPWGTPSWPPIGPDVTGGNMSGTGGFANNIPAELCYANTAVDSSYGNGILAFDAGACYQAGSGGGTPPAAPTALTAVPH